MLPIREFIIVFSITILERTLFVLQIEFDIQSLLINTNSGHIIFGKLGNLIYFRFLCINVQNKENSVLKI